jgi:hypothetical protein
MDPINTVRVGAVDCCAHSDWKPRTYCEECFRNGHFFLELPADGYQAEFIGFVPKAMPGYEPRYRFPLAENMSSGHTYDVSGRAFCLDGVGDGPPCVPEGWYQWDT